jgi:WhiB family redox-sensing transcriptional regulator
MEGRHSRGEDWTARAACRTTDLDALFVQGAAQNRAKAVCVGCGVRTECLADALDNRVEFGVWGGMTERERRALLRRRPEVTSWRSLLDSALAEYRAGYRADYPTSLQAVFPGDQGYGEYSGFPGEDVSALGA